MANNQTNTNVMSEITSTYTPPSTASKPQEQNIPKRNWAGNISTAVQGFLDKNNINSSNFLGFLGDSAGALLQAAGLGWVQSMFNKQESKRQEDAQIRAEGRANAEYDRRLADMRAYEDPSAVAQRYANAGINPLSVMTNGGPIQSQVSAPSASSPSAFNNNLGGLSGIANLLQTPTKINLNKSKIDNTDADTILKNWDKLLKDQLWNYNQKANPILLQTAGQELANLTQTYKNLVSTEGETKARTSEVYKNMQKLEEEITLLVFQQVLTQEQATVQEQSWRKMVEEIKGIDIDNKIKYKTWEDYYESGVFKEKSEAERDRIRALANQAMAEYKNFAELYNITDDSIFGQFMRRLMWIFDQLSFGANYNYGGKA